MSLLFLSALPAIVLVAGITALYFSKLTILSVRPVASPVSRAGRYQPMLRLLSESDFALVGQNHKLLRRLKAQRTAIFRQYVRCLALEYGRLLAGLRMIALQSPVDRPDLARAILQHRLKFATLLCRMDLLLLLHTLGIRHTNISGLVQMLDSLRDQTQSAGMSVGLAPAGFMAA
jgi:hypothetical protein